MQYPPETHTRLAAAVYANAHVPVQKRTKIPKSGNTFCKMSRKMVCIFLFLCCNLRLLESTKGPMQQGVPASLLFWNVIKQTMPAKFEAILFKVECLTPREDDIVHSKLVHIFCYMFTCLVAEQNPDCWVEHRCMLPSEHSHRISVINTSISISMLWYWDICHARHQHFLNVTWHTSFAIWRNQGQNTWEGSAASPSPTSFHCTTTHMLKLQLSLIRFAF